ncbi:MAG: S8 family serine peptidase [Cytophagales bacterium]|nr:S8 family serine peptidase [Cytophagales bacterium]
MNKAITIFYVLLAFSGTAQNKYLITFKDKANSIYSIERPSEFLSPRSISRRAKQEIKLNQQDIPVNPEYLSLLRNEGAKVLYSTKWLNGAVIEIASEDLRKILSLDFVSGMEGVYTNGLEGPNLRKSSKNNTKSYGSAVFDAGSAQNQLEMLDADKMQARGFNGKDILIGVFDSGFSNAISLDVFSKLYDEQRVIETYDFVNQRSNVYNAHYHGTHVLSCIAADLDGQMIGTAPGAEFLLYITENVSSETRMEEVNWLIAAERADSIGVDIITTSLGYSDFDGTEQDYTYASLDGNTALITRAADWAAAKGIIVVASAGNEGNGSWKYVTSPADADSIISVGAVNALEEYVSFSSIGPTPNSRIKPEVAAKGAGTTLGSPSNSITSGNGTSYAAPLIAGLMAGLKQAFPDLTAMELREILLESGSQAQQPDNLIGYGIPSFERAFEMANLKQLLNNTTEKLLVFPNPAESDKNIKILVTEEEAGSSFETSLTNLNGKLMYQESFKRNFFEIPLNQEVLPSGVYILKVWNENFSETKKVFIE